MTKTDSTFISELGLRKVGDNPKSQTKTFLDKHFENDLLGSVRRLENAAEYIRDKHNEHVLDEKSGKNKWDFENPDSRYELLRHIQTSYNVDRELANYLLSDVKRVQCSILDDHDSLPPSETETLGRIIEMCNAVTRNNDIRRIASEIVSLQFTIFVTKDLEILIPKMSKLDASFKGFEAVLEKLEENSDYDVLPHDYLLIMAKISAITKNNKDEINSRFISPEIWNEDLRKNPKVCKILSQIKKSEL